MGQSGGYDKWGKGDSLAERAFLATCRKLNQQANNGQTVLQPSLRIGEWHKWFSSHCEVSASAFSRGWAPGLLTTTPPLPSHPGPCRRGLSSSPAFSDKPGSAGDVVGNSASLQPSARPWKSSSSILNRRQRSGLSLPLPPLTNFGRQESVVSRTRPVFSRRLPCSPKWSPEARPDETRPRPGGANISLACTNSDQSTRDNLARSMNA